MINDSRKDSPVPAVQLNDDELAKVIGGGVSIQEITISKHFDKASSGMYQDAVKP
jgi:bacteriocin-like protein